MNVKRCGQLYFSVGFPKISFNFSKISKNEFSVSVVTESLHSDVLGISALALFPCAADFFLPAGWCSALVSTCPLASFNSTWIDHQLSCLS